MRHALLTVPLRIASAMAFTWISVAAEQMTKWSVMLVSSATWITSIFSAFLSRARWAIDSASFPEPEEFDLIDDSGFDQLSIYVCIDFIELKSLPRINVKSTLRLSSGW